jgi:16S rRNA (guanine527-N7)-methyltransferase
MDSALEKRLHELVTVFLEENAHVNLSAFRTEEACWIGNVLDSLAAHELMHGNVLDIGTGGGFPLLPLAMGLPAVHFTGMDATGKKIDAIGRIVKKLKLNNVALVTGRAEALGHEKKYREQFDVVTARAVADINVLLEYAGPFVKVGGQVVLWKSMNAADELAQSAQAQKQLHCSFQKSVPYGLPGDFGTRQLMIFEKTGKAPKEFPRAVGIAKKKPLL